MASLGSASFVPPPRRVEIDLCEEVQDRDVVLVPHGWHGPAAARRTRHVLPERHGGPGPEQAWKITDHPDQAWIRSTWSEQAVDPRLESDHG